MRRQRGFAYAWALMMVLITGIYLAEVAEVWQTRIRRLKEQELLVEGDEIGHALAGYIAQTATGQPAQYPKTLDDLVSDPRVPFPRRFLRKAYKDPITGEDWLYIAAPGGGIMGVYSKATDKPLKQDNFPASYATFANKNSYQDWKFVQWPTGGGGAMRR
ncbi:type II secretion system protein [Silvimonas amylolytica]|uniref:Type II secretion system pseudopilin TklG n=1 Tax=Silvimonas amylolytica TaxID=449663 RepID=A0ABQ2PRP3_9NEIS|nr:type II secretion system protein [Silvimonas amylolytica]GGP27939.1 type II secretion system pseudopilin TklG [Silvimonas amylolytica]